MCPDEGRAKWGVGLCRGVRLLCGEVGAGDELLSLLLGSFGYCFADCQMEHERHPAAERRWGPPFREIPPFAVRGALS